MKRSDEEFPMSASALSEMPRRRAAERSAFLARFFFGYRCRIHSASLWAMVRRCWRWAERRDKRALLQAAMQEPERAAGRRRRTPGQCHFWRLWRGSQRSMVFRVRSEVAASHVARV